MTLHLDVLTGDGTVAAKVLRRLADRLDGKPIVPGDHGHLYDTDSPTELTLYGSWGYLSDGHDL
jgi:hypothetical protein